MKTTTTTTITMYAVLYREKYFGKDHHEHRTDNIHDARQFTIEEGKKFILNVKGATLRPIPKK